MNRYPYHFAVIWRKKFYIRGRSGAVKEKRIIQICMVAYTNYASDARVRREAETLAALPDYKVAFLVLKEQKKNRTYELDGVKIIEVNTQKYRGKSTARYMLSYFSFLTNAFIYCNRLFFSGKADVFHVHNMPDFLIFSALLPKLFRRKIILDIHDSMPETFAAKFKSQTGGLLFRILRWEERLCAKLADQVVCVNHVQKEAIANRGTDNKKISVLLNVPDPNKFSKCLQTADAVKLRKSFNLVYHGTITRRLGVDLAIMAVAQLVPSIPGLQFHILGNGDDMYEFIELSRALGVSRSIHFNKKMVPVEQLVKELSGMHLGLISNRKNIATELMLPVKMLEYIALGIPVAVPELKGIRHYFSDEMVRYFKPEDIDSIAAAIEDLYSNQEKRAAQVQKANAFLDRYGWQTHKVDLINLYKNL